jgi:hypothetical protein
LLSLLPVSRSMGSTLNCLAAARADAGDGLVQCSSQCTCLLLALMSPASRKIPTKRFLKAISFATL